MSTDDMSAAAWPFSTQLFALFIGINEYQNKWDAHNNPEGYTTLQYAVADADEMERLFIAKGVPRENIKNLRDGNATRKAIIREVQSLIGDSRIEKDGASILIFYAGHGSRTAIPDKWVGWQATDQMIEMLCPADMGMPLEGSEDKVDGIADRTIAALLNKLSAAKGDNITVIFDCCCAAGATRKPGGVTERFIANPPTISANCDRFILEDARGDVRGFRGAGVARWFSGQNNESHILMAACGSKQASHESDGHGHFTRALLEVLRHNPIDHLSYISLMHKLQMPDNLQTPHCEGRNVHRLLFDKHSPGADHSYIVGQRTADKILLQAGDVHGITIGSYFGIYANHVTTDSNPQLHVANVVEVKLFSSVLSICESPGAIGPSQLVYAKQAKYGSTDKTRIYCTDSKWLESNLQHDSFQDVVGVVSTSRLQDDHMSVLIEDDHVFFERPRDTLITPWIDRRFPGHVGKHDVDRILHILRCAVQFQRHLTRMPARNKSLSIQIKFNRLLPTTGAPGTYTTLEPQEPNLINNNQATIVVKDSAEPQDEAIFGMTLHNDSDRALYPYLFYFDPNLLEIVPYYTSPFGAGIGPNGKVDAPLPPQQKLTIGYGDGGVSPWVFALEREEKRDVSFFKLIVTTSPIDLSLISQGSPFGEAQTAHSASDGFHDNMNSRHAIRLQGFESDIWETHTITVVQERNRLTHVTKLYQQLTTLGSFWNWLYNYPTSKI